MVVCVTKKHIIVPRVKTHQSQRDSALSESSLPDASTNQNAPSAGTTTTAAPHNSTYINYEEEEDFVDDAFHASSSPAAATAAVHDSQSMSTGYASMTAPGQLYPQPCVAIYDFAVNT